MKLTREGTTRFNVQSDSGAGPYLVDIDPNYFGCSCPHFNCRLARFFKLSGPHDETHLCKHQKAAIVAWFIEEVLNK